MKVVVYFNKRHFSGDENLTSRDSEENGWKRSRNILDYRLCLKINWKLGCKCNRTWSQVTALLEPLC